MQFDVSDLQPGDEIDAFTCSQYIDIGQSDRDYPMHLLTLAKQIESDLWRIGRQFTVRCQANAIRVLTHSEAAEYNESTFEQGKRKMRLAHRRGLAVDTSSFDEQSKIDHLERLAKQGRVLSFMRQRSTLTLDPVIKQTPKQITP